VTVSQPQPETKALTEARQDDNAHLVIDLSAVPPWTQQALHIARSRVKHHLHGGGHLAVITNPNASTIRELHTVAIRAAFDVHPTVAAARDTCARAETPISDTPPGLTTPAGFACQT
jgi:hypothetical protein